MQTKITKFLTILILSVFLSSSEASSLNFSKMILASDLIFTAEVLYVETSSSGSIIRTHVTFLLDETLKGTVASDEITLHFMGGERDGEGLLILGSVGSQFEVGDKVLLFAELDSINPIVGGSKGLILFAAAENGKEIAINAQGEAFYPSAGSCGNGSEQVNIALNIDSLEFPNITSQDLLINPPTSKVLPIIEDAYGNVVGEATPVTLEVQASLEPLTRDQMIHWIKRNMEGLSLSASYREGKTVDQSFNLRHRN